MRAVEEVNEAQKRLFLERVEKHFGPDLSGRTVAVWGLAFKPGTDDMRESPAIVLIEGLLARGAVVQAHDPAALPKARALFGNRVQYFERDYDALKGADALVVMTDWLEYRRPNFQRIKDLMRTPVVFDARNLYEASRMRELKFVYFPLGREAVR